jgi:hypothetical protein
MSRYARRRPCPSSSALTDQANYNVPLAMILMMTDLATSWLCPIASQECAWSVMIYLDGNFPHTKVQRLWFPLLMIHICKGMSTLQLPKTAVYVVTGHIQPVDMNGCFILAD